MELVKRNTAWVALNFKGFLSSIFTTCTAGKVLFALLYFCGTGAVHLVHVNFTQHYSGYVYFVTTL